MCLCGSHHYFSASSCNNVIRSPVSQLPFLFRGRGKRALLLSSYPLSDNNSYLAMGTSEERLELSISWWSCHKRLIWNVTQPRRVCSLSFLWEITLSRDKQTPAQQQGDRRLHSPLPARVSALKSILGLMGHSRNVRPASTKVVLDIGPLKGSCSYGENL